eukprot:1191850-Prorocentrum_minimum.AAC.1
MKSSVIERLTKGLMCPLAELPESPPARRRCRGRRARASAHQPPQPHCQRVGPHLRSANVNPLNPSPESISAFVFGGFKVQNVSVLCSDGTHFSLRVQGQRSPECIRVVFRRYTFQPSCSGAKKSRIRVVTHLAGDSPGGRRTLHTWRVTNLSGDALYTHLAGDSPVGRRAPPAPARGPALPAGPCARAVSPGARTRTPRGKRTRPPPPPAPPPESQRRVSRVCEETAECTAARTGECFGRALPPLRSRRRRSPLDLRSYGGVVCLFVERSKTRRIEKLLGSGIALASNRRELSGWHPGAVPPPPRGLPRAPLLEEGRCRRREGGRGGQRLQRHRGPVEGLDHGEHPCPAGPFQPGREGVALGAGARSVNGEEEGDGSHHAAGVQIGDGNRAADDARGGRHLSSCANNGKGALNTPEHVVRPVLHSTCDGSFSFCKCDAFWVLVSRAPQEIRGDAN